MIIGRWGPMTPPHRTLTRRQTRAFARLVAHAFRIPFRLVDPERTREPAEQRALHQAYRRRQVARRRRRRAR